MEDSLLCSAGLWRCNTLSSFQLRDDRPHDIVLPGTFPPTLHYLLPVFLEALTTRRALDPD